MKRFVTCLFIAALLFIMPTFGKDISSISVVTVTAPRDAIIINDTGNLIAVVNEKDNNIDWSSFVPIYDTTYLNFTDKDGDITILFNVNIENGAHTNKWSHFKIDNSNGQIIIRFCIDTNNGIPYYKLYQNNGYVEH